MNRVARLLVPLATGASTALAVGGTTGAGLGAGLAVASWIWLRRRPFTHDTRVRRRIAADLPYAVDLLASVLRSGAAPDAAPEAVGRAIGGPLGDRLALVARSLRLGAPAAEAWAYLGDSPEAVRLARAATRSEHSGAALSGSLSRLADDLRADRLHAAQAAAQRAGVLIVLPLGCCFLPAFVLAGVVPVIVAVLSDTLSR